MWGVRGRQSRVRGRIRLKMDRCGVKVQAVCARHLWGNKGRRRPGRATLTLPRGWEHPSLQRQGRTADLCDRSGHCAAMERNTIGSEMPLGEDGLGRSGPHASQTGFRPFKEKDLQRRGCGPRTPCPPGQPAQSSAFHWPSFILLPDISSFFFFLEYFTAHRGMSVPPHTLAVCTLTKIVSLPL